MVGTVITTNCQLSLSLPKGQLTAQALWVRGSTPLIMPITGGSGAYVGARGELTATDINTPKERYRIKLHR